MDVTAGSLSEFDGEAGAGAKSCEDATRESQLDFFVTALFSENAFIVAIFNWATVFVRSEVRNFSKHFTLCLSTSRGESDATFRRVGSKIFRSWCQVSAINRFFILFYWLLCSSNDPIRQIICLSILLSQR